MASDTEADGLASDFIEWCALKGFPRDRGTWPAKAHAVLSANFKRLAAERDAAIAARDAMREALEVIAGGDGHADVIASQTLAALAGGPGRG